MYQKQPFLSNQVIDCADQCAKFTYKKYVFDTDPDLDGDFSLSHDNKTLAEWPRILRPDRVRTMAFLRCVNDKATHLIDHTTVNPPLTTQYKFTPPVAIADLFGTATFGDYRLKLHAGVYVFSDHRTGKIITDHQRSRIDAKVYEAMKQPPRPMMLPAPKAIPALPAPRIAGLLPAPQPKRHPVILMPRMDIKVKIHAGRTDEGAHHRGIMVARKLVEVGLWDGEGEIWFDDVYTVHLNLFSFDELPAIERKPFGLLVHKSTSPQPAA